MDTSENNQGHVRKYRNHRNERFEGSPISKSKSYKFKSQQNNPPELLRLLSYKFTLEVLQKRHKHAFFAVAIFFPYRPRFGCLLDQMSSNFQACLLGQHNFEKTMPRHPKNHNESIQESPPHQHMRKVILRNAFPAKILV